MMAGNKHSIIPGGEIMVVEDSPTQALTLQFILEKAGYLTRICENGLRAKDEILKQKPSLVVSDINMPEMNGFELCRWIKSKSDFETIPVILLTSMTEVEDIIHGLDVKADYYVTKPYEHEFLLEKIVSLLQAKELVKSQKNGAYLDFIFSGKKYTIKSGKQQILNLLLSTYENAILQNQELKRTKGTLEEVNQQLASNLSELQRSDDRFRSLVKTIPDIVYRLDAGGNFIFLNDAIKKIGFTPEELLGKHFSKVILPTEVSDVSRKDVIDQLKGKNTGDKNAPKLFDERRTGARKTTSLEVRLLVKHKSGFKPGMIEMLGDEVLTVEVNSSGLYDMTTTKNNPAFIGTVGVIRDITERKMMESELKKAYDNLEIKVRERTEELANTNKKLLMQIKVREETEEQLTEYQNQLETILDNSPDVISRFNRELKHIYVNPVVEEEWGIAAEHFLGKTYREIVGLPEELIQKWTVELKRAISSGKPETNYTVQASEKGTRHFITKLVPEFDKSHRVQTVLSISRDITELIQSRDEKEKITAQLLQAQKMEALGALASGIAHDFNNILGAIMGFAELSKFEAAPESPLERNLQQVIDGAIRAKNLVKQILSFSRTDESRMINLDLRIMIKEVLKLLGSTIPKNIDIRKKLPGETCMILGEASQVHQVLMNLCTNAVQAMRDKGGRLKVALEIIDLGRNSAIGKIVGPGRYLKMSVSDSGEGMETEVADRIFEPYYTTKKENGGTGLGLSVVHGIVKSHGGSITVDSTPNKGSRFDVYFPKAKGGEQADDLKGSNQRIYQGQGRILLVDDESALVQMGMFMLNKLGYDVTGETSSKKALARFESNPQAFDLIISDFSMPGLTGIQLTKKVMSIRKNIPVIICSGYLSEKDSTNLDMLGISHFIAKPFQINKMSAAVYEALADSRG